MKEKIKKKELCKNDGRRKVMEYIVNEYDNNNNYYCIRFFER